MDLQCPGRDANTHLESALVPCLQCGRTVEIFGDEAKVHCRCGSWVFREALPSCAQWCQAAERCFGIVAGNDGKPADHGTALDQREQEKRFQQLQERIAAALTNCPMPEVKERGNT